jgi:two-component system KDP operon response regulator KdpE
MIADNPPSASSMSFPLDLSPAAPTSILVVEDDPGMARVFTTALEAEGYLVLDAHNGQRAIEEVRTRNPDLIILDLGLPDVDGLALVPTIRANTTAPIIVVSAREQEYDKVKALDAGANDYVTKPFAAAELLARVRVGLRSYALVGDHAHSIATFGEYHLDLQARTLQRGDLPVHLSPTEFKLLSVLARHANEVVTTHSLLREGWGAAYQSRASYVRVYMHALRQKLEVDPTRPKHLLNEAGLGYRLRTSG